MVSGIDRLTAIFIGGWGLSFGIGIVAFVLKCWRKCWKFAKVPFAVVPSIFAFSGQRTWK